MQNKLDHEILPAQNSLHKRNEEYVFRDFCSYASVTTAVLAHYGLEVYVVAVTSAAAGMVSWSEFSDIERKMTRYTKAIYALKELLYWWMATW